MGLGGLLPKEKWFLSRCLEADLPRGIVSVGVDGVDIREPDFLFCAFFVLGALALVVEWSS
jgi:hypothetical protein